MLLNSLPISIYMSNQNYKGNVLRYDSLYMTKSLNSVGDQYQLDARFILTKALTIQKVRSQKHITIDKMLLLNSTCEIKLVKANGQARRFILKAFDESLMDFNNITIFSILVNPQEFEELNQWINGSSVDIHWLIKGHILPLENNQRLNPIYINMSNWTDQLKPSISYDQFISTYLNPLKLNSVYYSKYPIKVSDSIEQFNDTQDELWRLIVDLKTLVAYLESAVILLRGANKKVDYVEILDTVKQSVDKIRAYCKDDNNLICFGDKLLIQTGIIHKTEFDSDEKTAAQQHMKYLFSILENLYQISSKARHTTIRERNKGENPKGFGMSPDRDEAVFVTELGLIASKYLISKIDNYLTRIKTKGKK